MINIDRRLRDSFPLVVTPINKLEGYVNCGAFLVLQLHDELIYEVSVNNAHNVEF